MSWQPGGGAASLRIIRRAAGPDLAIPVASAAATSATDPLPDGSFVGCYQLEALNAPGTVIARSDLLCVVVGISFGTGPLPISVQLNQSPNATVRWGAALGAVAYVLVPLGTTRFQPLPAAQTSAVDSTGGGPTCYVVATVSASGVTGVSNVVCAIPGLSSGI
jgi:hypothetical protein